MRKDLEKRVRMIVRALNGISHKEWLVIQHAVDAVFEKEKRFVPLNSSNILYNAIIYELSKTTMQAQKEKGGLNNDRL